MRKLKIKLGGIRLKQRKMLNNTVNKTGAAYAAPVLKVRKERTFTPGPEVWALPLSLKYGCILHVL